MKSLKLILLGAALLAAVAEAQIQLRQSTASQAIKLGPFVDSTDGNTQETALTIANTDVRLSKNGGTLAAKNSGGCTHDANGWYTCTFDATDSNTVGRLTAFVHVSGALPVFREFQVLEEATYDITYAASATGAVPVGSVNTGAIENQDFATTPGSAGGLLIAGTNADFDVTGNVSLADGLTITRSTANQPAISATGNGTGHGMLLTSGGGATGNGLQATAVSTNGNGIGLTATGSGVTMTLTPANVTQFGGAAGTFASGRPEVNTSHWGGTAVASAVVGANAIQISGDSSAADALELQYDGTAGAVPATGIIDRGTAQSATGTTLVLRSAASFADDNVLGATIVITGGSAGVGQSRTITDYVSSTDTATVDTWTTTPTGTITYEIYGTAPGAPGSLTANDVWTHATRTLTANTNLNDPSAAVIADAVWDEARSGHTTSGTFGQGVASVQGNVTGSAASVTGAVGSVTGAVGSVTGNVTGSVGSVAAGGITAASLAADALTAAKVAADVGTEFATALQTQALNTGTAGSVGEAIGAAGSAGDPWTTALPGSYSSGQAGFIVGTNINATVSSRASQTSVDDLPTAAENRTEMDTNSADLNALMDARTQLFIGTSDSGDTNTLVDAALTAAFASDDLLNGRYVVRSDGQACFAEDYVAASGTVEFGACVFTGAWSTQTYKIYPAGTQ